MIQKEQLKEECKLKPMITMSQEETEVLLDFLHEYKEHLNKHSGMENLYTELEKKYDISKGNIVDKN